MEERVISFDELKSTLANRSGNETIEWQQCTFNDMDLNGYDLHNINFSGSNFNNVIFDKCNLDSCNLHKTWFKECSMREAKLTNADVTEAGMRYLDLSGSDFSGSDFHFALFEYAILENITDDENTKFYRMACPEEGAFIAWKCCTEWRVVQLLVPADAKRVSATAETCRCNKAKVLSIKSIDETISYDWAQSTVDQDFYYEVGKWVEPANRFEEDRWMDSSPGIHFFMKREQCVAYQTV